MTKRTILGAILAAAAAPAAAQTITVPTTPVTGTVLEVSAEGEVRRVPDLALVRAGVVAQAANAAAASAETARRMAAVVTALRRAGIGERDLQTTAVELQPQYRYGENQPPIITGYQATGRVEVRFRDVDRAGRVLDALVAAGANQIDGPNLLVDEPEPALDEARAAAMRVARARAELYARAAGLRVKRILAISESGALPPPVPMPVMARMVAQDSAAATEILPGEQRLAVTISVRFELE